MCRLFLIVFGLLIVSSAASAQCYFVDTGCPDKCDTVHATCSDNAAKGGFPSQDSCDATRINCRNKCERRSSVPSHDCSSSLDDRPMQQSQAVALAAAPLVAGAQVPDKCMVPLSALPNAQPAREFWKLDRQVSIFRRETNGRSSYRIVGDIVELTPQYFPALDRPYNQAFTKIDNLWIEARELIVGMPIRVAEGSLLLAADKISFTGDGFLTIVDPPSTTTQTIEIQADVLDLSMARNIPFAFATQGWKLNEPPQWPAEGSPSRIFRVKAGLILPGANDPPEWNQLLKDRPLRWVHNKTADRGFDSGLGQEVWSRYYDVLCRSGRKFVLSPIAGVVVLAGSHGN